MKKLTLFFVLLINQFIQAQPNYAISYDGSNDYVSIPASVAVSQLNTFTVEAWVYWNGTGSGCIYSETIQGNNNPMFSIIPRSVDGGGIELVFRDNTTTGLVLQPAAAIITPNAWIHFAVVRTSATNIKTYINGILKDNVSFTAPAPWTPNKVNAGLRWRAGQSDPFSGQMDELRIWNIARTAAEIRADMFNKNLAANKSGLVAYYRFNEGSGINAVNSSTNTTGIDGTLNNGAGWQNSPVQYAANALSLDGSDDYALVPWSAVQDLTTSVTMEAWVYPTNSNWDNILMKGNYGYGFALSGSGGTGSCGSSGNLVYWDQSQCGSTIRSSLTYTQNLWQHVAVTVEDIGPQLRIYFYVNGVQDGPYYSGATAISNGGANSLIYIGAQGLGLGNFFAGSMDELRVWNVVRTQSEIQAAMSNEVDPLIQTGLIAYYTFNQGIAAGTNSSLSTIIDQKGDNNAQLVNFALSGSTSNYVAQSNSLLILPIQWQYFNAQKQSNGVVLSWATSNEQHSNYYSVQHSPDSRNWKEIGIVAAAGVSNNTTTYNFTHSEPIDGLNYYRIVETDLDGKKIVSEVRTVRFSTRATPFKILDNPVNGRSLLVRVNEEGIFSLHNSAGLLLWSKKMATGNQAIEISTYSKGLYFLKSNGYLQKVVLQ